MTVELLRMLLFGVALPAALCVAALLAACVAARDPAAPHGSWAGAVGLAAGYVCGHWGIDGVPAVPPVEEWEWLFYLAPLAMALGLIATLGDARFWTQLGLALLLAAVAAWQLVPSWWQDDPLFWRAMLAAATIVLWLSLGALANRLPGAALLLVLLLVAVGSSLVLVLSGNAKFGQLAGVLAVTLAVSSAAAWWRPRLSLTRGAMPVYAVLLPGLVLSGHFNNYLGVPAVSFMLLLVAPLAAWVSQLGPLRRLGSWQAPLVGVGMVLLPVATAVALAFGASQREVAY